MANLPFYGTAFSLTVVLHKSDGSLITNPGTLTDKISKDWGDYGDPDGAGATKEDSTYGQIKVALGASDMTANHIDGYVIDDTMGCLPTTFHIDTIPVVRGLAGTALPNAAADAAGGLPISDAGGLDLDTYIKRMEAAFTSTIAGRIDAAISTRSTFTPASDTVVLAAIQGSYAPAKAGDKMDLVDAPNSTALVAIRTTMQAAGQTLATLLSRIVGTLKSGNHEPQSGDAYAKVNNGTYGNEAIKTAIGGLNNLSSGDVGTAVGTALGSYGAAKAGDRMDLVDAPNATAREAIRTTIQAAGSHLALIKAKTDNLPASPAGAEFKKNTAKSGFTFFMADSADHVTGKTGLNVTATRSLDGAAFDACANNVAEISGGFYKIDLAATDLNGDIVVLKFSANGADVTAFTIATGG
jgi:hypothetical protein